MSQRALLGVALVLLLAGAGVIVGADVYAGTSRAPAVRYYPAGPDAGVHRKHHFGPGAIGPGVRPRPSQPPTS
jgi:hypothetical protein